MAKKKQKTPKWLRKLEKESWQAELLISGLALYGSFQLPEFVHILTDFFIRVLPKEQYMTGYFVAYMVLLGVCILSTFFMIHFILRMYWIGLIGLNSVFPKGYNPKGGYYSPVYVKTFTSDLPKVRDSIKKIDDICSSLFAGAFGFLLMYGTCALTLSILLLVYNLLLPYIPKGILLGLAYGLGLILSAFVVFSILISMKRFHKNEKLQTNFAKISKYFGYIISGVFYKPTNQLMMTFYSNHKKNKSSSPFMTIAFITIAIGFTLYHIRTSNIRYLIHKGQTEEPYHRSNWVYSSFYENQMNHKPIIHPIIESDQIHSSFLKVFIPIFKNEDFIQDNICGEYQSIDSLDDQQNRSRKRIFELDCYSQYHQIFVNDSLYKVEFLSHRHPNNNEFGILCYVPSHHFKLGKNEVRTVKLKNNKQELYEELTIPFWYNGKW